MKTPYDCMLRLSDVVREIPGQQHNHFIQWAFTLCGYGQDTPDEVPNCSVVLNAVAWLFRLPRSKSAAARSWLAVGTPVTTLEDARVGYDIVILNRTGGSMDATVKGPAHVAFFAGVGGSDHVFCLGANQKDAINIAPFKVSEILGIRRLG